MCRTRDKNIPNTAWYLSTRYVIPNVEIGHESVNHFSGYFQRYDSRLSEPLFTARRQVPQCAPDTPWSGGMRQRSQNLPEGVFESWYIPGNDTYVEYAVTEQKGGRPSTSRSRLNRGLCHLVKRCWNRFRGRSEAQDVIDGNRYCRSGTALTDTSRQSRKRPPERTGFRLQGMTNLGKETPVEAFRELGK